MEKTLQTTLRRLEETHGVRILYAVESGSRAWGFASKDSDYDVRYIYVRREEDYLRIHRLRDNLQGPLNDVLDFSGWDLQKALHLLRRTNPSLMEWAASPIVYREDPLWADVRAAMPAFFCTKRLMLHYLSMARQDLERLETDQEPRIKSCLYLLRTLLCALWLERFGTMPPIRFDDLVRAVAPEPLRPTIRQLLDLRRHSPERSRTGPLPHLATYCRTEWTRLHAVAHALPDAPPFDDAPLDALFRDVLRKAWQDPAVFPAFTQHFA